MKRALSGIKSTGQQMHIGNYLGAVKQFVELQNHYESFIFIANLHSLTTVKNKKELYDQTLEIALEYLACGLDPKKTTLFFQSDVPEVTELAWTFNCLTPMGLLNRAHAYKDAQAKNKDVNVGLFDYPVLMAADILIYKPHIVPVGKDQKQHVEIARDIAEIFNKTYGETFVIPEYYSAKETETVLGLDGQKMSKSYKNTIDLFEDEKSILKKVKGIVTDSKGVDEPKDPETCNIFRLYKLFAQVNEVKDLKIKYIEGGIGYGRAKEILFEVMMRELSPIRERYKKLATDKEYVLSVMREGGKRAKVVAKETIEEVRKKIGIV